MANATEWEKIYGICCGIDVHKKLLVACLNRGNEQEVKEFGASTREILELVDWLMKNDCEIVAMESTGSYWKPLYNILEAHKLPAIVVNAQHMKAVPGRKTDVNDAQWIAKLLQHGLLRASFIPDKAQRELRELVGYRKSLVEDMTRELNRLQKMLEGANIKLSGTVSDIAGKSAMNLLEEVLNGTAMDKAAIARMRKEKKVSSRLKATDEQLADDLTGFLTPLQTMMIREVLSHIKELAEHIRRLEDEIDRHMDDGQMQAAKKLEAVTGIGENSAKAIISVIGTDMSRFPTDAHISSWAGLCPGNNESAKKRRTGKTRKGNKLLRTTLVVCAHAAIKNKASYFAAQYQRICAHRGGKRAIVAVAHSMLIAIYHILRDGVPFRDLGADYFNQFNRERKINSLLKKLKELGWEEPFATAAQSA